MRWQIVIKQTYLGGGMEKGAVIPPDNSSWSNAQPLPHPERLHSSFTSCFGTEGCCRDASVGSHLHKAHSSAIPEAQGVFAAL